MSSGKYDSIAGLTVETQAFLRQIGAVFETEGMTMGMREEQDEVIVTEPVQPRKDVQVRIEAAEPAEWTVKAEKDGGAPGHEGEVYKAMKLTLTITDPGVESLPGTA